MYNGQQTDRRLIGLRVVCADVIAIVIDCVVISAASFFYSQSALDQIARSVMSVERPFITVNQLVSASGRGTHRLTGARLCSYRCD